LPGLIEHQNHASTEVIIDMIDAIPMELYPTEQIIKLADYCSVFKASSEYWQGDMQIRDKDLFIDLWDAEGALVGGATAGIPGAITMGILFSKIAREYCVAHNLQ
jgi:hypothetical protein